MRRVDDAEDGDQRLSEIRTRRVEVVLNTKCVRASALFFFVGCFAAHHSHLVIDGARLGMGPWPKGSSGCPDHFSQRCCRVWKILPFRLSWYRQLYLRHRPRCWACGFSKFAGPISLRSRRSPSRSCWRGWWLTCPHWPSRRGFRSSSCRPRPSFTPPQLSSAASCNPFYQTR